MPRLAGTSLWPLPAADATWWSGRGAAATAAALPGARASGGLAPALLAPPVALRATLAHRRAAASAFFECLCTVHGHCVAGGRCPDGEHVDSSACQQDREVSYAEDNGFWRCAQERDKCEASWPDAKPKEECSKKCTESEKRCQENCRNMFTSCNCKPKGECMDETPGCWPTQRCEELIKKGCALQIDKDLKLRVSKRRVMVTSIDEHSWAYRNGVRKGSELVSVDGDTRGSPGGWRSEGERVLHDLDWSKEHKFAFRGPMPSGLKLHECRGLNDYEREHVDHLPEHLRDPGPDGCAFLGGCSKGSVCCAGASSREQPEDDFVVECANKHLCKVAGVCAENPGQANVGTCKYQVAEL